MYRFLYPTEPTRGLAAHRAESPGLNLWYTNSIMLTNSEKGLAKLDPILGEYIKKHGTIPLRPDRDYFEALASSIISQQISVKAAAKIFARFKDATRLQPSAVLTLSEDDVKAIGLSGQKARYIRDLAEHFVNDSAIFNHLNTLPDDEVITELTRVKGIGVWTAQMFLIFTLHRPDIFAPDDRGLQLAIQKMYKLETTLSRAEPESFAMRWAPYRSTACLHLWYSLDNQPK